MGSDYKRKKVICETFNFFCFSLNVILTFLLIFHFGLTRKFKKLYTIMILRNYFDQNLFLLNTVITNSFVTLPSQFSKFTKILLFVSS